MKSSINIVFMISKYYILIKHQIEFAVIVTHNLINYLRFSNNKESSTFLQNDQLFVLEQAQNMLKSIFIKAK